MIYENEDTELLSESAPVQTETGAAVALVASSEDLQEMTSDIVHADLFGSFLICGTLVGIILFGRLFK